MEEYVEIGNKAIEAVRGRLREESKTMDMAIRIKD